MLPQPDSLWKLLAVLVVTAALLAIDSGFTPAPGAAVPGEGSVAAQNRRQPAAEASPPDAGMYAVDPKPLANVQCGQCHTNIYHDLKNDGGRHRFSCLACHKHLHEYQPLKNNWQELMPRCSDCHTVPHGGQLADCAVCHHDPHGVTRIPMNEQVVKACGLCHGAKFEELRKYPSAHTKVPCSACHTRHGFIPNCNACHKAHYEGEDFATCARECHPVHRPREISYQRDVGARTCGVCHGKVYDRWLKSPSKHAAVNCAACHSRHGYIPPCTECHPAPHSRQLLDRFPRCLVCHQDPHDPPVKARGR